MTEEICKDCGMLLPPEKSVCPVCGFDNHFVHHHEAAVIDPELAASLTDDVIPSNLQGY